MKKLFYAGVAHASYPADKLIAAVAASESVSLHFDIASSEPAHVDIEAKTEKEVEIKISIKIGDK